MACTFFISRVLLLAHCVIALSAAAPALGLGSKSDPTCKSGLTEGDCCCPKSCGQCGGPGCGSAPGGAASCCTSAVKAAGASCAYNDPPCVITPAPAPPTPAPGTSISATIELGLSMPLAGVDPEYVSFNLDCSMGWGDAHLADATLRRLVAALAPAHLRVGGTQCDYDVYALGAAQNASCATLPPPMTDYRCKTVTADNVTNLLEFCVDTNVTLVYGLNDMYGRPTKTKPEKKLCDGGRGCPARDQSNLIALLHYLRGLPASQRAPLVGFELGNELNTALDGVPGAHAQADDFSALREQVERVWSAGVGSPAPSAPFLAGPDTHSSAEFSADGRAWLSAFVARAVSASARPAVDKLTFHMYAMGNGENLDPATAAATFLDPTALDKAALGGAAVLAIAAQHGSLPVWAGETAAANNGGCAGVTDTFMDGFWYIDQLGALAAQGVSVFQRQVLLSTKGYPLIEGKPGSLIPLPDYFIALLHKRIMGQIVLAANSSQPLVRVYAHCASRKYYGAGAVAVIVLNVHNGNATINFSASGTALSSRRDEFILTPGSVPESGLYSGSPLQSKQALLNGVLLALTGSGELPSTAGRARDPTSSLIMPPRSYGFAVLRDAGAKVCT